MQFFSKIGFFLLAFVSYASSDIALLPGSEPIQKMYAEATLVCRCSVVSTQILQKTEKIIGRKHSVRQTVKALLQGERIYKTDRAEGSNIAVVFESPGLSLKEGQSNLLLFLKAQGREYAFVEPTTVFLMPAVASSSTADDGLRQIEDDLASGVLAPDRTTVLSSLRILQCFDTLKPSTLVGLARIVKSSDPGVALAAHAVLLKTGDPEEVVAFANFEEKARDGDPVLLMGVNSALNQIRNPIALSALERLSRSPSGAIKLGALQGIRSIGSANSIPTLVEHLDDSDPTARYIAVITLSEITHKSDDHAPAMDVFEKESIRYIAKWKTWWQQEGRALYEHPQN